MIKTFTAEEQEHLKANIYLKDGKQYLSRDLTATPFGANERMISFWDGDTVFLIPLTEVARIALYSTK